MEIKTYQVKAVYPAKEFPSKTKGGTTKRELELFDGVDTYVVAVWNEWAKIEVAIGDLVRAAIWSKVTKYNDRAYQENTVTFFDTIKK